MAVDGGQFVVDDSLVITGSFQVLVQDGDGVLQFLDVHVGLVLLSYERLLEMDKIEGVMADGFDLGGKERVRRLSEQWPRAKGRYENQYDMDKTPSQ